MGYKINKSFRFVSEGLICIGYILEIYEILNGSVFSEEIS